MVSSEGVDVELDSGANVNVCEQKNIALNH